MITVTINRPDNEITGFVVDGHAKFKPHGEDIVCAAVSVLTQTALLGLGQYIVGIDYKIETTGHLECNLPELDGVDSIRAEAILETMVLGLKNIEKNYPGYIEVNDDKYKGEI